MSQSFNGQSEVTKTTLYGEQIRTNIGSGLGLVFGLPFVLSDRGVRVRRHFQQQWPRSRSLDLWPALKIRDRDLNLRWDQGHEPICQQGQLQVTERNSAIQAPAVTAL